MKPVDNRYINIVQYNPLKGSSYIQLPSELRNFAKGLINLKSNDSECLRWCDIRHLNPQEKHPQRIKKKLINNKLTIWITQEMNFQYQMDCDHKCTLM